MHLSKNIERDRAFWILFLLVTIGIGLLNSQSSLQGGLVQYYLDFVSVIKGGFDPSKASLGRPTFPMWGYGWIYFFTTERFIIFVFQVFLSMVSVMVSLNYLYESKAFNSKSIRIMKVLILLSFSWIAIHFTLAPYSVAVNLLIISLIYLLKSLESKLLSYSLFNITISAACFGLLLNFKSDYIYFNFVIALILYWGGGWKRGSSLLACWALILGVLLTPWAIYTKKVVGKPLLTSTNGGAISYIGLGHLPDNKWGITVYDADPRMASELRKALPQKEADAFRYEGDKWLKKRFLELIISDPLEYSKKVLYSARMALISGIYIPEFHNLKLICKNEAYPYCKEEFKSDVKNSPISSLFDSKEKFFIHGFSYLSIFIGILILLASYLALPFVFLDSIRKKNIFLFSCCLVLLYQLSINSFVFQQKSYSTNAYFFGMFLLSYLGGTAFFERAYSFFKNNMSRLRNL